MMQPPVRHFPVQLLPCHCHTTASTSMSATTEDRVVDELGDLWLVVPSTYSDARHTTRFRVCSRALARCSPVFRTMLYGPFVESRPADPATEDWVVTLEDDDAIALEDLLYLMHSRYDDFSLDPRQPDTGSIAFIEALYHFITAVDKYDCASMLRPWAQSWVAVLADVQTMDFRTLKRLAWIYFQLGDRAGFQRTVRTLVVEFPPSGVGAADFFGEVDDGEGDIIAEAPGLEESITSHRCALIKALLSTVQHLEKGAFSGYSNQCAVRSAPHEDREACQDRLRKTAIRHLLSCGFWPLPRDPRSVTLTPRELWRLVSGANTTGTASSEAAQSASTYSRPGLDDGMASSMSVYSAASRLNSQVNGTPHGLPSRHLYCTALPRGGDRMGPVGSATMDAFAYTPTCPESKHLKAQALKTGLCLGEAGAAAERKPIVNSGRKLVTRSHHLGMSAGGGTAG
ncbi:BTB/POZ domain-containing protein [Microdochium nivale]|nr:BTB/POZ domain-containing protein [Microdochium nivale]